MVNECKKSHCILLQEKDREILELKKKIVDWKKQATIDQMTGLINKSEGFRKLRLEIENTSRDDSSTAIAFIDIDRLKLINDKFGHCVGDQVLVEVSNILHANIRKEDFVFRFGGDEFIIVFTNMTILRAKEVWDRVYHAVELFNKEQKYNFSINLSVGFSEYNLSKNVELDKLIHLADSDMYREKQQRCSKIS